MQEYRPLKDISVFVNTKDDSFIIGKHTSHANVKVSFGYSCHYVYVSNYQSSDYSNPKRGELYLEKLIDMYTDLRDKKTDDDINWKAIHQETIDKLKSLRGAGWHYLGQRGY